MKNFKFYRQLESLDCGPTCLKMIAKYHGKEYDILDLRDKCHLNRSGTSLANIIAGSNAIGLKTMPVKVTYDQLSSAVFPCILHWRQDHYVIALSKTNKGIKIADPGFGIISLNETEFGNNWLDHTSSKGIALILEPNEKFHTVKNIVEKKAGLFSYFKYLKTHQSLCLQIIIGMLVGSLINLLFPIITQQLVDKAIKFKNISLIIGLLTAQVALFLGSTSLDLVRSRIVLFLSTKIGANAISDFLYKLTRLPIAFFDTKLHTDILLRIDDHSNVESFMTSSSLNTLFSFFNFLVFSILLCVYDFALFLVFISGSLLSIGWIYLFMNKLKSINYRLFELNSYNRNSLMEMVKGMKEIKLNNAESYKRFEWQKIQVDLFNLKNEYLSIEQNQKTGFQFINQLKNIIIIFIAAKAVVTGDISLGVLLSVSFIIGQLNAPIEDFVHFFKSLQNAKISFKRLGDIYSKPDEDNGIVNFTNLTNVSELDSYIEFNKVDFNYDGPGSPKIFNNLNLKIPINKVTAIVGSSGSGKTTLLKLLLKFYNPTGGNIVVGDVNFSTLCSSKWRSNCGAVMQDGYIFSDSIAKNITLDSENVDLERLRNAARMANILDFIDGLPQKFNSKIGDAGIGLSTGQQQRILIARVMYKNPNIILLDEATSSLDANNEKVIVENFNKFFENKTVVIIAHRLSTVKNADKIVVLEKGKIIEEGTHDELVKANGAYLNLIKNQLELGD
ncbi:peptidase domain-containing ABC transporter [Hymenobacter canadensis]|uniref:Peptidase domain-containing ABC transporter n=1 Tax=Hymenobacter canadensis TaxID=2999067 RepID=A0ABY7LYB5_9BACT|nr:peptidase domain-containing ABC transporter [Hymenobacter canadensis]WBA44260.1 peptidase domain-containing ABC transporter [Hymenobacter canadensis]